MIRLLLESRIAADAARCARDSFLGIYNASVARAMARNHPRSPSRKKDDIRRILVIKLDRLGDVILASSFFRELRRNYPDAAITALTSAESFPLMRSCPYVNQTIPVPVSPLNVLAAKRLAHSLRAKFGSPDLTIIPRFCVDLYGAGWISFFSGAPARLAFSESVTPRKSRVNRGADALFTDVILSKGTRHEVERNLEMLRHLGLSVTDDKLEIWSSESEAREADSLLGPNKSVPLIAVGLGASQTKKMWPVERYVDVCRRLHSRTGAQFVAMGSRAEVPLLDRFKEFLGNAVAVSGAVNLGTVASLFRHCGLFLGSDSAQKHIAAAVGLPIVEVSCHAGDGEAGNGPVRFKPWRVPQVVLQPHLAIRPCKAGCEALVPHCILNIQVTDVERAITTLIASTSPLNRVGVLQ